MSGVDIQHLVRPGEIIAGKYRIERVLGQGGMGVVVAAHHIQLDERVAIKFLLADALKRQDLLARFQAEARAAVKIKSEHVARVIDVAVLENGAPYMVMEFLEGVDLAARIQDEGPIPWQQASDFILQACEAIVEAHALGIVHRDLKPANLFLLRRADGLLSIKVLDFGISKTTALSGSGGSDMTQTQSMLGSPFYMSPEQMQSARSVDMRTDIWALGVILYQGVMGEVPFEAETLPELVLKIVQQQPTPMRVKRPDIPTGFEQVVMRCLEKDRDKRYQHIGELASALVPFAPERSRASAERILRVVQTSGLMTRTGSQPNIPASTGQKNATQLVAPVSVPLPSSSSGQLQDSRPGAPFVDSRAAAASQGGGGFQHTAPHASGTPGAMGPPLGMPPPGHNPQQQQGSFGGTSSSQSWQSAPQPPKNNSLVIAGALLGFIVIMGGAVFAGTYVLSSRTPVVPSASVASSTGAPPPSAVPSTTPSVTVTTTAEPPPPEVHDAGLAAATPDASLPATLPATRPTGVVTTVTRPPGPAPGPAPSPAPAPQPAPGPATKPGCNPPYTFDKAGNKVFKTECL